MEAQTIKCKERVGKELKERIKDIRKLWRLYINGDEDGDPDLGTFNEYGLSFDYVAPNTFKKQRKGYFRYQLSLGGPSDEFRFYTNPDFSVYKIEYWFLDWFDGAKIILKGGYERLLTKIFEDFKDCGIIVQNEYEKASEE